ncbi:hypothetical protein E2562_010577 [Oryza meyeriana var. granulata]|uniref:Uncharacterized protein n=1 Tax=Oryza meyeriana var. granulata TaxID=110450 RepID=A0A6G1BUL0_9ORYZ|nr:hypothetical protein E2562_010577 [Oryza meyeriana var. granulata]
MRGRGRGWGGSVAQAIVMAGWPCGWDATSRGSEVDASGAVVRRASACSGQRESRPWHVSSRSAGFAAAHTGLAPDRVWGFNASTLSAQFVSVAVTRLALRLDLGACNSRLGVAKWLGQERLTSRCAARGSTLATVAGGELRWAAAWPVYVGVA